MLVECATHAIIDAAIGAYRAGSGLTESLLPSLAPGMLLLADRGFNGYRAWQQARQTGADVCGAVLTTVSFRLSRRWPMVSCLRRDLPE